MSERASGVVLHPTSLPGPHGIGDLGDEARRFVDWLASGGQRLWQMLPLNPIGPGHSPYQSPSAFAGSGLMVALQPLVERGWLEAAAIAGPPDFDDAGVDHDTVIPWRWARLAQAAQGFRQHAKAVDAADFAAWQASEAAWLDDWALFAALKDEHGGQPWWAWGEALARRDAAALQAARQRLADGIATHRFVQWCFDRQLAALRAHAHAAGVRLMGDLPIFVAHDSADVWARPDLFFLDEQNQLTVVAGCPPDAYSADGQRWGNPLYRWNRMQAEGFAWWLARVRRALAQLDVFRIDHFRGFAACWEVPADSPTARRGRWAPAPGMALFSAMAAQFGASHGRLPIVAEDLGTITPDVIVLRDHFGIPGMRIVHEAFMGDARHDFLPHNHVPACLAYSSTHDSDTVLGWWRQASAAQRAFAAEYLQAGGPGGTGDGHDVPMALIRATSRSVANLALFTLQDVLSLDGRHRMNLPGSSSGNWRWRFDWGMVGEQVAPTLARIAAATGRGPFDALTAQPAPRAGPTSAASAAGRRLT
ncbi:MAG: 4-alpha-glucanotransferase [Leptothrix sp. (in: Bacteria)]|nr:4-alpha-glucanotransferase [Leptothrix sp. (in: b-proteobacteria)]